MHNPRVRRFLSLAALATAVLTAPAALAAQMPATAPGTTTVVVVRHAEKATDDPRDPTLSPAGTARAAALAQLLSEATVSAVYTTQFKRTHLTAEPAAAAAGVTVTERPIAAENMATYALDLAREIMTQQQGKTVLVVGHSNTVPAIVLALSGQTVPDITDPEYDHVFIVQIPQTGPATVQSSHYGTSTSAPAVPVL
ncbi:MAG: Phosphoglycerate mutase [Gemmatimonadetes bacterium]|nr:Phosphoglycerate mutase [Gemmatimonadota bacterium]